MPIDAETLRQIIIDAIPDVTDVKIEDMRGDGIYYAATIVAPAFTDISKLDQHRIVYTALKAGLGPRLDDLQGLQLTTRTPHEDSLNAFE